MRTSEAPAPSVEGSALPEGHSAPEAEVRLPFGLPFSPAFSSLRHRDFRYLWLGVFFSSSGLWMEQVAMGWLVYTMTDSPLLLGMTHFFRMIPSLLFGLPGGVATDRLDRKGLLTGTAAVLTVLTFLLAALVTTGWVQVWHVFVIAFLGGVAWSFHAPARHTMVSDLVRKEDLMNAIALSAAAWQTTKILGPMLAGLLLMVMPIAGVFFIQGLCYVAVALWTLQIRGSGPPRRKSDGSPWKNLVEGFVYIRQHSLIWSLLLMALVPIFFGMPYTALMPIFARDVFGIGASGLGVLLAAPGIGALVAALGVAARRNVERRGWVMLGSVFLFGLMLIFFAYAPAVAVALPLLVLVGASSTLFMTLSNTSLQLAAPAEYRGRVLSIFLLDRGIIPFGSFAAGALADVTSAPFALALMGLGCALCAVGGALGLPSLRRLQGVT